MAERQRTSDDILARRSLPASDPRREMALLARLPARKQALVLKRLRILDSFMSAQDEGQADPGVAAEALGLSVRSLYRLVSRVREVGPVSALAPTPGAGRKRRSDADATLSPKVLDAIRSQVIRSPHQSMSALVARVKEIDPHVSASTVRRRAMRFRRDHDPLADAHFGRRWLLDQAALSIPVMRDSETSWLVATFLVDVDTGLIFGRSVVQDPVDAGLGALLHALGRAEALLHTTLKFAPDISEVTWAVPDGLREHADAVFTQAGSLAPPVRMTMLTGDKFRRATELSKLMGGGIGAADILIRATADPRVAIGENDPPAMDEAKALAVLDADIMHENMFVSRWAKPLSGTRPPTKTRVEALRRLMAQLVDVFEPVLSPGDHSKARGIVAEIGRS